MVHRCYEWMFWILGFFTVVLDAARKPTVVITGGNSGIGLSAMRQLAALNSYDVVIACRSLDRGEAAKNSLKYGKDNVSVRELDLADFDSVRKFCSDWGNRPIDCLCLNAGVQFNDLKVVPRTKQGFEETIGVNHIGHWLLTNLLLEKVKAAPAGRIVFTGSGVHNPEEPGGNVGSKAGLEEMTGLEQGFLPPVCMINGQSNFDGDKSYKDSKLCNVITTIELARRLKEQKSTVTCNTFNPGLIPTTGLFRGLNPLFVAIFTVLTRYVFRVAVSEDEGGERLVKMITDPIIGRTSGGYYSANGKDFGSFVPLTPSREAQDPAVGKRLWALTEKVVLKARRQ